MPEFLDSVAFSFKGSQLLYEDTVVECKQKIIDICLGQYGDGCGGGRIFILFGSELKVYNPENNTFMDLPLVFKGAKNIHKKACELFINLEDEMIMFNLSSMKQRPLEVRNPL